MYKTRTVTAIKCEQFLLIAIFTNENRMNPHAQSNVSSAPAAVNTERNESTNEQLIVLSPYLS